MPKKLQGPSNGDHLEGRYANYFEIGHNAFEFLLDFGQLYLGESEGWMHTRIVTSPVYAKNLAAVLIRTINQYEQIHGPVPDPDDEPGGSTHRDKVRHIQQRQTRS